MKKTYLALLIIFISTPCYATTKYWVGGGSGTGWAATGNTNWSLTDGGANNAAVPVAGDDVVFDAASAGAACAVSGATAALNSLTMTGYTGTFSSNKTITVEPASGTVNVVFPSSATWTDSWTGTIDLYPATGATIDFTSGGNTFHSIAAGLSTSFNGTVNQEDTLNEAVANSLTLSYGTWNTNGYTMNLGLFSSAFGNTRAFNFSNSTINLGGTGAVWSLSLTTGMTLTSSGSTINITDTSSIAKTFAGGGLTYGNLSNTSGTGGVTISGSNTFNTLTVPAGGTLDVTAGTTQTVSGLVATGTSGSPIVLAATGGGTAATISSSSGTNTAQYSTISFIDVTGGANWIASNNDTVLYSTGWAPLQTYWVRSSAGTYTWTAPAGVTSVVVQLWGSGAGASTSYPAGAGGGGAYAQSTVSVTPGNSYTIVVGAGGAVNTNGNSTTFNGTTVVAVGGTAGSGGTGGAGGAAGSCTGTITYSGGSGGNNASVGITGGGWGGNAAGNLGSAGNSLQTTDGALVGAGGGTGGTAGVTAGGTHVATATAGVVPGGGGGGGDTSSYPSQAGADGQAIISYPVVSSSTSLSLAGN